MSYEDPNKDPDDERPDISNRLSLVVVCATVLGYFIGLGKLFFILTLPSVIIFYILYKLGICEDPGILGYLFILSLMVCGSFLCLYFIHIAFPSWLWQ